MPNNDSYKRCIFNCNILQIIVYYNFLNSLCYSLKKIFNLTTCIINFKTIGSASVVNKHIIYSWAPIFPEFRDARLQEFY